MYNMPPHSSFCADEKTIIAREEECKDVCYTVYQYSSKVPFSVAKITKITNPEWQPSPFSPVMPGSHSKTLKLWAYFGTF